MRLGKFTRIPERPSDLAELWHNALPISPETLPLWALEDTSDRYRYLVSISEADLTSAERGDLLQELELLKNFGLAIDTDERGPMTHRIYVPGPRKSDIWSIGIFIGDSPFSLIDPASVQNPVLTSSDVTDALATFVADPFMITRDGTWYMFFEIMNWELGRGQIGFAQSQDGFHWSYRGVVLTESFHLSYPYVFESDGHCYMIPETHQARSVRLYEAISFPTEWSYLRTLVEGPYFADPCIVRHRDTWWLFVETSSGKKNDTLRLYWANELEGPWIEHPDSPIVRGDSSRARPGGRVIVLGNSLIRYAQNCSRLYGSEVLAFEITELTQTRYSERPLAARPVLGGSGAGWNACGMHHIDPHLLSDGRWLACVDGWQLESGWAEMGDSRADIELGLMRRDIEEIIPPGSTFLLVDKNRGQQMSRGLRSLPFPECNGEWGGYPADDAAAIAELDRLRREGAEFIVFPTSMLYWLETYPGLRRELNETSRCILTNDLVRIFRLRM
jgi:hypothetical protein